MHRILLADDEPELARAVQLNLRSDGYEVITAADGFEALVSAGRYRPDLVILEVAMRGLDGWQVCHSLRRDPDLGSVPILFFSHNTDVEERLRGFDAGADDFLSKPCDLRELKARVRALLRRGTSGRSAAPPQPRLLTLGDLALNPQTGEVRAGERGARLTPAEMELLRYLMDHPNTAFSSQHLLRQVWGYAPDCAEQGLVRWHIMNLRTKIEPEPARPIYLCTVPRHGYMLSVRSALQAA